MSDANPQPLDYSRALAAYRDLALKRRDAVRRHEDALRRKAAHERDYRKQRALRLAVHRSEGCSAMEALDYAKSDAADHAYERDIADAEARGMKERIDELEGDRASLRQLIDWSRKIDPYG